MQSRITQLTAEDEAIQHRSFEALRYSAAMISAERAECDAAYVLPIGFRVAITHDTHYERGCEHIAVERAVEISARPYELPALLRRQAD